MDEYDENEDEDEEDNDIEDTLDSNDDQMYVPLEDKIDQDDPYPSIEKKKEIVKFFRSGRKNMRTIGQMKHRYTKLNNLVTLYRWEKQIEEGNVFFFKHFLQFYSYLFCLLI